MLVVVLKKAVLECGCEDGGCGVDRDNADANGGAGDDGGSEDGRGGGSVCQFPVRLSACMMAVVQ